MSHELFREEQKGLHAWISYAGCDLYNAVPLLSPPMAHGYWLLAFLEIEE